MDNLPCKRLINNLSHVERILHNFKINFSPANEDINRISTQLSQINLKNSCEYFLLF